MEKGKAYFPLKDKITALINFLYIFAPLLFMFFHIQQLFCQKLIEICFSTHCISNVSIVYYLFIFYLQISMIQFWNQSTHLFKNEVIFTIMLRYGVPWVTRKEMTDIHPGIFRFDKNWIWKEWNGISILKDFH